MEYLLLFFGASVLSIIHTLVPNHWLPIISISKTQNWSRSFTNLAVIITASMHSLSTIIVGSLLGLLGIEIFKRYEFLSKIIPSLIFVIMGIIFVSLHIFDFSKHHHHHGEEFHLYHSHIKSIVFLSLVVISIAIGSFYFLLRNGISLEFVILVAGLIVSVVSIILVQRILSRKHYFNFYSYHEHNGDLSVHNYSHTHSHNHIHFHSDSQVLGQNFYYVSKFGAVFGLGLALFFSPCVEIEVYYIQAATLGIGGVVLLSLTYLSVTVGLTFFLVNIGESLIAKLKLDKLDHNEDFITGIILIVFSLVFFLV